MVDISKILGVNIGAILHALTPKVTFSFATAAWILLFVHTKGWFLLPPVVMTSAFVVGIVCSCLVGTNFITSLWTITENQRKDLLRTLHLRRDQKRVEQEIDFLTPSEKNILAYLLIHNQKMIEVLPDGEEAATLISKGFLVPPVRHPPAIHRDIQVAIPDHVWNVLTRYKEKFSYRPVRDQNVEVHPWRTHWMVR